MPTHWRRIAVTEDPPLRDALEQAAPYLPASAPARLVHDLAIRGAKAVVEEQAKVSDQIEALVAFSTQRQDLNQRG